MKTRISGRQASGHRRRQILDAALGCFLENGFDATTIDRICTASGASHGSIYHHFGSKAAIALALYVEGMHAYQAEIIEGLQPQATAGGGIRAMIVGHLRWSAANANLSLYLTRVGVADASGEMAARIAEVNQEFFRAIHDWIKPFVAAGEIVPIPANLYVPLIFGPVAHVARHWLAGRLTLDLAEAAEVCATATLKSLRP